MKPQAQRLSAIGENRSGGRRSLPPAILAMPQAATCFPGGLACASGTDETAGPTNPLKVLHAGGLVVEPIDELLEVVRIGFLGCRFHITGQKPSTSHI